MSVVTNVKQIIHRYPPDGKYKGSWSGYEVKFEDNDGDTFEGRTENGLRGIDIPCEVTIENGVITAKVL